MTTTIQIPAERGGTDVPYNDGSGAYGMASANGYGYAQYWFPMLSEYMAMLASYWEDMAPIEGVVTEIGIIGDNIASVQTVGANIDVVITVAGSIANVNAVGSSIEDVSIVATNISAITLNAVNIAAIQQASNNATTATIQAGVATDAMNAALGYSQTATAQAGLAAASAASASSVAQQDLSGVVLAALYRGPSAVVGMCFMDTTKDSNPLWPDQCGDKSYMSEVLNGTWLGSFASEMDARDYFGALGASSIVTGDSSTFAGGVGAWGSAVSASAAAVNGRLRLTAAGANPYVPLTLTTVPGQRYRIEVMLSTGIAAKNAFINVSGTVVNGAQLGQANLGSVPGLKMVSFVASGTTTYVTFSGGSNWVSGEFAEIDNFTMTPVDLTKNPSGAYYNDATDGKHKRLWKNLLPNTVFAGAVAGTPGTQPSGWIFGFSQGTTGVAGKVITLSATTGNRHLITYFSTSLAAGVSATFSLDVTAVSVVGAAEPIASVNVASGSVSGPVLISSAAGTGRQSTTVTAGSAGAIVQFRIGAGIGLGVASNTSVSFQDPQVQLGSAFDSMEDKTTADGSQSETLRGNKAKPPRLGIAVATASQVVIYDALEPGRPMWMVFAAPTVSQGVIGWAGTGSVALSSLAYREGRLLIGGDAQTGLVMIDFAKDSTSVWTSAADFEIEPKAIAQRNGTTTTIALGTANRRLAGTVNAVAMTTMPDAPADPVTGLQVPTVACFTAAGISTIHNNGTVVNSSSTSAFAGGAITPKMLFAYGNSGTLYTAPNPGQLGAGFALGGLIAGSAPGFTAAGNVLSQVSTVQRSRIFGRVGTDVVGLVLNEATPANSLVFRIAPTYNTGLMLNPIRAWACDTTAGVTGSELTSGSYATPATSDNITTVVSATSFTQTGVTSISRSTITLTTVPGTTVVVRFTLDSISANLMTVGAYNGVGTGGVSLGSQSGIGVGPGYLSFVATGTTTTVLWACSGGAVNTSVSGVSIKEGAADRSYKNKPLTVMGSLTKTPVAAASQAVFYGNFSAANYGFEAYSADWDALFNNASGWSLRIPTIIPSTLTPAMFPAVASISLTGGWTNGSVPFDTFSTSGGTQITAGRVDGGGTKHASIGPVFGVTAGKFYRIKPVISANSVTGSISPHFGLASGASPATPWSDLYNLSGLTGAVSGIVKATNTGNAVFRLSSTNIGSVTVDSVTLEEVGPAILFERSAVSGASVKVGLNPDGTLVVIMTDAVGATRTVTTTAAYNTGQPVVLEPIYTPDGALTINVNGKQVAQATGTPLGSMTNATATVTWGNSRDLTAPFPGQLAMFVAQQAAPFAEQSTLQYETQKQMFLPGAQITLADSATLLDMDYDAAENSLTVVSATARSKFVGMVRVSGEAPSAGSFSKASHYNGIKLLARSGTNPGVDITMPAQNLKEELQRRGEEAAARRARAPQVFDFDATASQADFPLPVGYEASEVISARSSQREGAAKDWARQFDGFKETVHFNTGQALNTWVQVIAKRGS